jgi:hypothetical protein
LRYIDRALIREKEGEKEQAQRTIRNTSEIFLVHIQTISHMYEIKFVFVAGN